MHVSLQRVQAVLRGLRPLLVIPAWLCAPEDPVLSVQPSHPSPSAAPQILSCWSPPENPHLIQVNIFWGQCLRGLIRVNSPV